jgi:hypothetical protein
LHECRAASALGVDPVGLVARELTVAHDRDVFSAAVERIYPTPTVNLVHENLKPPTWIAARQRGRPKGKRIHSAMDTTRSADVPVVVPKMRKKVNCGKCGEEGHNSRTCSE